MLLSPGWKMGKRDGGRVTSGSWNPIGGRQKQGKQGQEQCQGKKQEQKQEQEQEQEQEQVAEKEQEQEDFRIPHQVFIL